MAMYNHLHGIAYTVLRASNPFGVGGNKGLQQGLVPVIFKCISENTELGIWGDGEIMRDYIYIDDLVSLCVKAGQSTVDGIYNAGSGVGTTINQVIDIVENVSGKRPEVKYKSARELDVKRIVLNISRTKTAFDWNPETSLENGVARLWQEHCRNQ
jgi:UDP-glucose 4-epimerase